MQHGFGAGVLVGTATTDAFGNALNTPQPVQFGILQECSVEFSFDTKELFGQFQFPVAIGRGKGKITGKAKNAQLNGLMMNTLLFGQTLATGIYGIVADNVGTAVPTTPYTITPTVPGSGTWTVDLGVIDPSGVPMQRVVSGPTAGQYSVASGVYTFAAADVGKVMRISFRYTASSTTAKKLNLTNLLMGQAPLFSIDLYMPFQGKQMCLTMPANTGSKISLATKLDDFMVPEFDWSGQSDAAGNIGYLSWSE